MLDTAQDPNILAVLNTCPDHQSEGQGRLGGRQTMARRCFAPAETNVHGFTGGRRG
jgi:hypothetical protein